MRLPKTTMFLALLAAAPAAAQQPAERPAQPPSGQEAQLPRTQRMQDALSRMDRVMGRVHLLNQWMMENRSHQSFRDMGKYLEESGERMRDVLREVDQLHRDPAFPKDPARLREMDRLHQSMTSMAQELDRARESLRQLVGG